MASVVIRIVATTVAAYLIGGIPWGLLISRVVFRDDVRTHGSGNIGATNVWRTYGPPAGIATFALDALKGAFAVALAWVLTPASTFGASATEWAKILATAAVILGHSYSPYLRMHGGKSVAVAAGAGFVVLLPQGWTLFVVYVAVFIVVTLATRMISAGSIAVGFTIAPLIVWKYWGDWPMIGLGLLASAVILWRHRTNMVRIWRGEERKIGHRDDASSTHTEGA